MGELLVYMGAGLIIGSIVMFLVCAIILLKDESDE